MNKMYLVLGDWSHDGHNQYEKVLIEANKTVKEIQDAYKASCKLTGLQFHDDGICCNYEEHCIDVKSIKILEKFGIKPDVDFDDNDKDKTYFQDGTNSFNKLWVDFVKLSLPDLNIRFLKDEIPVINGFWNKNLNETFGYGLFVN